MSYTPFGPFRRVLVAVVAVLLTASGPSAILAQSPTLAELAKKEQERRRAQKAPAKVYKNKDLPPPQPGAPQPAPPAPATGAEPQPPAGGEQKPEAAPSDSSQGEAHWRARMNEAREELRRNEMFAEALQSRINGLSTDFVNRDDPAQRARVGEDRDKALTEFNRVKGDIEKARKRIQDIEEEARKAGVPAGWLR
jgi:hypothetical protein